MWRSSMNIQDNETVFQFSPGVIPRPLPDDKQLSSWLYANIAKPLSIGGHEYDEAFMLDQLNWDAQKELMNVYLNTIKKIGSDNPETDKLLHSLQSDDEEEGYDAKKVISAISYTLKNDFQNTYIILDIFREMYNRSNQNILEEQVNEPFFKKFCDGLKLNKPQSVMLFLAIANAKYNWIFPNAENHEYNSRIFCWLLDEKVDSEIDYANKINNKLIEKGLFSSAWTLKNYVYFAFSEQNDDMELTRVIWPESGDIYDYKKLYNLNRDETDTSFNLLKSFCQDNKNCIQLVSAPLTSRAKLFLNHNLPEINRKLYEVTSKSSGITKEEIEFYLYLYSLTVNRTSSVVFLDEYLSSFFCAEKKRDSNVIRISNVENETKMNTVSLLSFITVPLYLYTKNIDGKTAEVCRKNGIEIWNTLNIKLSDSAIEDQNARRFFSSIGNVEYFKTACDFVSKSKLDPYEWNKILQLGQSSTQLTIDQFNCVLEKKYPSQKNIKQRKNEHYDFNALNTSVSPEKLQKYIKKAIEFQAVEYNSDSGYRVAFVGPSGTGKTSIVEEIAKANNVPLKIVTASDFLGSYVGETEQNIKKVFEEAAATHSMLLVDEADSMIHSRGDTLNRHNDIKVNEFITQMEFFPGILFCNTNYPEALDKATDRRFDLKVEFKPLTEEGVNKLVASYFGNYNLTKNQISEIYKSGDVTPGDFNVINRQIRFMDENEVTSDFITQKLCSIVKGKTRSFERTIGFGN